MSDVTCQAFDDAVAELATGALGEPERSALLAHAATCPSCQARLDELAVTADRLLLLAPAIEPPAGFEGRVLARIGARPPATRRRPWLVAAAAAVVALLLGLGIGHLADGRGPTTASARIVTTSGVDVGHVSLLREPAPMVVLVVDRPQPWSGTRRCELELRDGRRVDAGSWGYDDVVGGVWATAIDPIAVDAVRMRVLDEQGREVASASF